MDFGMPTLIENKDLDENITLCRELGLQFIELNMNLPLFQSEQYFTLPDRKVYLFDTYRKEYMEGFVRFRELCERVAGDSGIKMCIENTDGFQDFEKEAIGYLLQSEMFGLTWDIGHSHGCGNVDEPFLMERKDRLLHFHIHDGKGSKNHQTLGTGEIDLAQRLGLAKANGCRCVVETKTVEALRQSVAWLRGNGFYSSNKSSL